MYVHVAIARKLAEHQDILTYHVPNQFEMQIHYGSMVAVPMGRGNQEVQGYVVDIVYDVPEGQYKEVISVLEPETLLNQELTNWPYGSANTISALATMCWNICCRVLHEAKKQKLQCGMAIQT